MAQLPSAYYADSTLFGGYQYMTLIEMVNRIERETTDQDSFLANIRRSKIVDVAKDGIRELAQHVTKHLKAIELTLSDSQYFALPQDYVDWKRVSLVGPNFRLHTLYENNNIPTARGFLQDSDYNILFSGAGAVLEADASNMFNKPHSKESLKPTDDLIPAEFKIYEERGVIAFSEEMIGEEFIIEYISDGLEAANLNDAEVYFHKMIYAPLMDYIISECVRTRRTSQGFTQADKVNLRNRYLKTRHEAKVASLNLDLNKLMNPGPSETLRKINTITS